MSKENNNSKSSIASQNNTQFLGKVKNGLSRWLDGKTEVLYRWFKSPVITLDYSKDIAGVIKEAVEDSSDRVRNKLVCKIIERNGKIFAAVPSDGEKEKVEIEIDEVGEVDEGKIIGIIYVRLSDGNHDWKAQLEKAHKIADRTDVEVVDEFVDEDKTGENFRRIGWEKVKESVKENPEISRLVVRNVARIGRKADQATKEVQWLEQMGVKIQTDNNLYDMSKAEDLDEFTAKARDAEEENEKRKQSSFDTRVRNFVQKEFWFKEYRYAFFGYVPEKPLEEGSKKSKTKEAGIEKTPNEEEREAARKMFKLYDEYESYAATARKLDTMYDELDTPDERDVRNMLKKSVYAGEPSFPGEVIEEECELETSKSIEELRYVEDELFERVQKKMEKNRRKYSKKGDRIMFTDIIVEHGPRKVAEECMNPPCEECNSGDTELVSTEKISLGVGDKVRRGKYRCEECGNSFRFPKVHNLSYMKRKKMEEEREEDEEDQEEKDSDQRDLDDFSEEDEE